MIGNSNKTIKRRDFLKGTATELLDSPGRSLGTLFRWPPFKECFLLTSKTLKQPSQLQQKRQRWKSDTDAWTTGCRASPPSARLPTPRARPSPMLQQRPTTSS